MPTGELNRLGRSRHVHRHREQLRQSQRDAIWKWRWLGMRDSTLGFKGSIIVLGVVAVYIALVRSQRCSHTPRRRVVVMRLRCAKVRIPLSALQSQEWRVETRSVTPGFRHYLGLSAALVMHLGSVRRTITSIREALGSETPPIVVGGNAFRGGNDLWKHMGADHYSADASEAVTILRYLRD